MRNILLLAFMVTPLLAKQPAAGSQAIDFTLARFNGEKVTLSQLQGKIVLLDFWASWCTPCREELPMLDILQKTYGKHGFEVIAVNIDNKEENALKFLEKGRVGLRALWDKDKKVVASYDVNTMPTTFIIDKRGMIRFVHSGFKTENFQYYKRQIESLLQEGKHMKPQRNG